MSNEWFIVSLDVDMGSGKVKVSLGEEVSTGWVSWSDFFAKEGCVAVFKFKFSNFYVYRLMSFSYWRSWIEIVMAGLMIWAGVSHFFRSVEKNEEIF